MTLPMETLTMAFLRGHLLKTCPIPGSAPYVGLAKTSLRLSNFSSAPSPHDYHSRRVPGGEEGAGEPLRRVTGPHQSLVAQCRIISAKTENGFRRYQATSSGGWKYVGRPVAQQTESQSGDPDQEPGESFSHFRHLCHLPGRLSRPL